ncbi:MAG: ATP-binding protein [Armatimonadetes bacterium]|nr:ATP-binding protein [Armatimonadota bacterium]
MTDFRRTGLWQRTLAEQGGNDSLSADREKLRAAYEGFRKSADALASEISRVLPSFTVHDLTHSDALWEMADIICGPGYELTPTEAFVLGGAFLIHDLGMGLSAYPEGLESVKAEVLWKDTVVGILKSQLGRPPKQDEIENASSDVVEQATAIALREHHAERASELALTSWKGLNGEELFLIENSYLRSTFGPVMGDIAASHWMSIDILRQKFHGKKTAPGDFDRTWVVEPLKLACILRCADFAHLDDRRAPSMLAAIRKLKGESEVHWLFQQNLNKPIVDGDRLRFSSKRPLTERETAAWWLCFDTLSDLDSELRHVDELLIASGLPRFAARGVIGADSPSRMVEIVKTKDWLPVDARIKVGDVAKLAQMLGGEKLYGSDMTVPLRELIQNGTDAVNARRLKDDLAPDWGSITVRWSGEVDKQWIEVEDTGIGMSAEVLTGPFLDFGSSFWGSTLMHKEFPGLQAKGYASTGQFGIGFFSVFMWGDRVQVVTRRADKGRDQTIVLEFTDGLESRPILRPAKSHEQLIDGGTRVKVWLKTDGIIGNLLSSPWNRESKQSLWECCANLCPTLDVQLDVNDAVSLVTAVEPNDWMTLPGSDLLRRIRWRGGLNAEHDEAEERLIEETGPDLELLNDNAGRAVGRICLAKSTLVNDKEGGFPTRINAPGIVTVGGLRSCGLGQLAGILLGAPTTAVRNSAIPLVEESAIAAWATDQKGQIRKLSALEDNDTEEKDYVNIVQELGGDIGEFPIADSAFGLLNRKQIAKLNWGDEVIFLSSVTLYARFGRTHHAMLNPNVLVVDTGRVSVLQGDRDSRTTIDWPIRIKEGWETEQFYSRTLLGIALEAVAESWGVSVKRALTCFEKSTDTHHVRKSIGTISGKPVELRVNVLRRPSAP